MNFKKTMLASLLMISASGAFAADTATLNVKGTIAPVSCGITIGSAAESTLTFDVSDYTGAQKALDPKTVAYNISCPAPGSVFVSTIDTKSDSVPGTPGPGALGLGKHTDGKSIGYFTAQSPIDSAKIDGLAAAFLTRAPGSNVWARSDSYGAYTPDREISYVLASSSDNSPTSFTQFVGELRVAPVIAAGLSKTDSIDLDGSVTLTVKNI